MPSELRIIEPHQAHHVVIRGNNRQRLFSYQSEYKLFVTLLAKALDLTKCQLHALSVLSHHAHFLITPPHPAALSRCVKYFSQLYALQRNRRRAGSGKLFEQRFFCKPILVEKHLAQVTAYIDLNPELSGMRLGHYPIYPWSSYPIHIGQLEHSKIPLQLWTPSNWYESLGRTTMVRAQRYRECVREQAEMARQLKHIQYLEKRLAQRSV